MWYTLSMARQDRAEMTARKGKEERKMMTYPTLEKAQEAYAAAAPGRCKAIAEIEHRYESSFAARGLD